MPGSQLKKTNSLEKIEYMNRELQAMGIYVSIAVTVTLWEPKKLHLIAFCQRILTTVVYHYKGGPAKIM